MLGKMTKMKSGKTLVFMLFILVLTISLVGCGGNATKTDTNSNNVTNVDQTNNAKGDNANNQQNKRDELVLGVFAEVDDGFDPTIGWGRYGSPLFQSTLLTFDNDLNVVNDLAKSYKASDGGLVWTVELRDDVSFSDGVKLTAEDVVYTFETAKNSGSVVDLDVMESVKAIDDYKVEFNLKQQNSTFINTLITTGIVPKHAHNDSYANKPIGSGPFVFVQWDRGEQLIVETNPNYYGDKPSFKKITFLFLDENTSLAAAKAGQVDIAAIPAAFANQKVANMRIEALQTVDNRGIMFPYVKAGKKTADGVEIGNDVTADIAIRKAINVAIDRQALVEGVLEGYGTPAYTMVDGLPWWNPETVIKDADMATAEQILADGGWQKGNDGILRKGDLKAEFKLVYPASDATRQALALATADLIRPLGINIVTEGKSWDDLYYAMHSNAVLYGWGAHTPLEMYNLYSSKTQGFDSYNAGFYSNAKVDEYLELAMAAATPEEAYKHWKAAQWDGTTGLSAVGDAPWAWLVNIDHVYLVNDKLDIGKQRIQPHGHGWPITANIAEWQWK